MKKNILTAALICAVLLCGCKGTETAAEMPQEEEAETVISVPEEEPEAGAPEEEELAAAVLAAEEEPAAAVPEEEEKPEATTPEEETDNAASAGKTDPENEADLPAEPEEESAVQTGDSRLIVIDAGHQAKGNSEKEPIGPGASEMKAKVAGGTKGVSTGVAEYELTLQVALKLQTVLEDRGYEVLMVRTASDVNISNSERAAVANDAGAAAFIRIHANGSTDSSVHGAMTICQTPDNPYNGSLYARSRSLSDCILDAYIEKTGARKERVWETDSMSGINWAAVPVTIIEMGYMTNPEEDEKMATEDYQELMAEGMADGIDRFFAE